MTQNFPRLPINRKEKFYTATVLPMIACDNKFAHFHRLANLCGLTDIKICDPTWSDFQCFTEYSFSDLVFMPQEKTTFADRPIGGDTPDLVVTGADWLLAIEAKMFHRPGIQAISNQIARQAKFVEYWRTKLRRARFAHVLLLPVNFKNSLQSLPPGIITITWEDICELYRDCAPQYWLHALSMALKSYSDRASPTAGGQNCDARLSGEAILAAYNQGDSEYTWMGRIRGLQGPELQDDIATGKWKQRVYEVRYEELRDKANWFPIRSFVDIISGS